MQRNSILFSKNIVKLICLIKKFKITEKKKEIILSLVCSMSVVALAAEPNSYVKLSLTDAEIQERIERALQIKSLYEQLRKKLLERRQLH